jgi:hypothetical protein
MIRKRKLRRLLCGGALLLICLVQSGCAEFLATNIGDNLDYDQRYNNAKSAGLSDHEAKQRAFEGQYFHDPY